MSETRNPQQPTGMPIHRYPAFVPVGLGRGPRINLELVSRVSSRH